jgi:hypothetical protein
LIISCAWCELSRRAYRRLQDLKSRLFYCTAVSAGVFTLTIGTGCSSGGDSQSGGSAPPPASTSLADGVFTYHNDNARTGRNLKETILTPANVNSTTFGLLLSIPVDGQIYAQPLYALGVNVGGSLRNVVFVATQHDSVYAFDADAKSSTPLWHMSFINPAAGVTTIPAVDTNSTSIQPEVGITSTPVIDPNTGTLYVVARTKEVTGGATNYVQRLHALDVSTGTEKFGGPAIIQASLPGTGDGNDGQGNVLFDGLLHNQRTGLLLSKGVIYIAWASHSDNPPYHGWVLGYDATTLKQVVTFNATINGGFGGIWQSGGGLSADDDGNVYLVTGNGTFDANTGGSNYGDSVVKLSQSGTVLDYFTPFDQADLAATDKDLGSTPVLLLPPQSGAHPNLVMVGGKNGALYSIDRDNMGHFNAPDNSQIVQFMPGIFTQGIFGAPVYFNNSVYFSAFAMPVQSFLLNNGLLTPTSKSATAYNGYPGGTLAISANGSTNGILWTIEPAIPNSDPAILHAYDATDLAKELYNSSQAGTRDLPDVRTKFTVPTVFNGKVYVGTNTKFCIYGLL